MIILAENDSQSCTENEQEMVMQAMFKVTLLNEKSSNLAETLTKCSYYRNNWEFVKKITSGSPTGSY